MVNGNTAAMTNSDGGLAAQHSHRLDHATSSIANSTGQTVFTGSYNVSAGNNQPFEWNGQGNDGTQWPDGNYTMTATAKDAGGNTVAITTAVEGVVSSVDLTQSPPLLTIGGQTYTVSQIQSIVHRATAAAVAPATIARRSAPLTSHSITKPAHPGARNGARMTLVTAFSRRFVLKPWA